MNSRSKRWFILVCILFFFISFSILHEPNSSMLAFENNTLYERNPFLTVEISEKNTNNDFRLVDAQIIDDQMLENFSPALVAPEPVKISQKERNQINK
jgi:hypothetical protein